MNIQNTVDAAYLDFYDRPAYRICHKNNQAGYSCIHNKGGVHPLYTETMHHTWPEPSIERWFTSSTKHPPKTRQADPMDLITVYDCPGANLPLPGAPPGVKMAGYTTGYHPVPWTPAQFAQHPDAIRIDQAPVNTPLNEVADVLDVEPGAATMADIADWVHAAQSDYEHNVRPGQRTPLLYVNQSELTDACNALVAAGITSGVGLWLAAEMDAGHAANLVTTASGPYPIRGVQFAFMDGFDVSVFSKDWFDNVSGKRPVRQSTALNTVQVEYYKDGFGWVLAGHFTTPQVTKYRARVSDGVWADWQEFDL
jgi:hypothetical protein